MAQLRVPLVRWTRTDGSETGIHVLDVDNWLMWTLCGVKVPPRTSRVYRSIEPLELAREYALCSRCKRSFGVPLAGINPRRRRRRRPYTPQAGPIDVTQVTLFGRR